MCFECVQEQGLDQPFAPPDGWHIERNMKPIPDRRFDWDYWHDDYDGADGGNGMAGSADSYDNAVFEIMRIEAA